MSTILWPSLCVLQGRPRGNTNRYDYKTGAISDDVVEQTEQTLLNIAEALTAAGAEIKDIVRVQYILPDRKDFPKTWPVLQKWFGEVRPAATMIQADLMEEAMKIEIVATARKASAATAPGPVTSGPLL